MEDFVKTAETVTATPEALANTFIDALKTYFDNPADRVETIAKVRVWLRREVEQEAQLRIREAQATADRLYNQI